MMSTGLSLTLGLETKIFKWKATLVRHFGEMHFLVKLDEKIDTTVSAGLLLGQVE